MKTQTLAVLISAVVLGACVDPADDAVAADPRLATNGMTPSYMHPNNLDAKVLTGRNIAATPGMEDTVQHQVFTGYLVGCALSPRQSVSSTFLDHTYTYPGALGLAPSWTTRPLTLPEVRAVSACVISRANLYGINITISMRGDSGALGTTPEEAASYNIEEAAFYGDIFTPTAGAIHACNGVDQVRLGDTYGDLPYRQCGQPDPYKPGYTLCGFVFDGNCRDICDVDGDHYASCTDISGSAHPEAETIRLLGTAP